jgi:uncharacterized SAM-binding protein YcdF (DUF218 family)
VTTLLVLALVIAIWLARRGRSLDARRRMAGWIAVLAALALAAAFAPPLVALRKLVGFVLMPATLIWLGIAALVVRAWREPRWRWPLLALLAAYSIAGSPWTAYLLLRGLERPFEDIHPLDGATRYDALLVMGGGTSSLPHGDASDTQLGASGDRVRLAAALYGRGRTPFVVASGSSLDGERDLSAETSALWREMGIPDAAIVRLADPRNSAQEVAAYVRLVEQRGWERVAVVTSARHLRRALALCQRHGLPAEGLPSDFRAQRPPFWDVLMIVPNGEALAEVEKAVWEYVGLAAVHLVGG